MLFLPPRSLVSRAYFGWWSWGWGRGCRLVKQTLHLQVTSSQEMTQRALEGEPRMKALCPLLNLGAQLAVWVCPFLERRSQRDLVNGTWGVGWVGSTEGWRTAGCEGPGICVTGTVVAAFVCVRQREAGR